MNKDLSNKNEEHESLEPSAALVNIHNNVYISSDFQSFTETEFNLWYIQMHAQLVRLSLCPGSQSPSALYAFPLATELTLEPGGRTHMT